MIVSVLFKGKRVAVEFMPPKIEAGAEMAVAYRLSWEGRAGEPIMANDPEAKELLAFVFSQVFSTEFRPMEFLPRWAQ